MNKLIKMLMVMLVVAGSACTTSAQDDGEKKIKIKISKKVDGDTKTFEGEYASEEEMRNDPAYREFSGDDNEFSFFFDGNGDHEKFMELHRGGANAFSFSFDEDMPRRMMKNFNFDHRGPNVFWFGNEESKKGRGFNSEEFERELEEKMKVLEEKMKGLDKNLQEEIMKSMREIEEMHSGVMPRRMKRGGVSVEDAGEDFGKRGVVDAKDKLVLDDINYMVMNKKLNLRFSVKNEGELSVKISNLSGKDIYNRYFEKFGGTFSDTIDFNQYATGKYLLEISQGKKRLTKKLVIE